MSERVACSVLVTGDVQGVFFRDCTREEAERHGVVGWVRNREDGGVEALLEGDSDAVSAVIDFCRAGSPQARVRNIEVTDREVEDRSGFEVR